MQERRNTMLSVNTSLTRCPKAAFSDFDFVRLVVSFIGSLANSLNSVLTFIQNLISFGS